MVVDLSVGNDRVLIGRREDAEGLFPLRRQVVDGQSMEADDAGGVEVDDGVVRSPWLHLLEPCQLLGSQSATVYDSPDPTHLSIEKL